MKPSEILASLHPAMAGATARLPYVGSTSPIVRHFKLDIPPMPPMTAQVVGRDYMGYSIEYSDMVDFAGNLSHPNTFSYQLLSNLAIASGACPNEDDENAPLLSTMIRAGGSPQNRAFYVPTQDEAFIKTYPPEGGNKLLNFTIGPSWFESFQTFPGVKWIIGLSFEEGLLGKTQSAAQAVKVAEVLEMNDIYGLELGNEIDGFPGLRRDQDWTIQDYVQEWHEYSDAVIEALEQEKEEETKRRQPVFQTCSFLAPEEIDRSNASVWNVESAIRLGIMEGGKAQSVADHKYMGSVCSDSTEAPPTIEHNLLDHHHTTKSLYLHEYLGNVTASWGIPYVLGETGSVSCWGAENVSDSNAAAIWAVDYLMYLSSLKVSRVFFHQGTGFHYSSWMPISTSDRPRGVLPQYYGNLLTAHALNNEQQQVLMLVNECSFTAYGIYEMGGRSRSDGGKQVHQQDTAAARLSGVVLVNLEPWYPSAKKERPQVEVELPLSLLENYRQGAAPPRVRRLTSADGSSNKTGITFAGQTVNSSDGLLMGQEKVEKMMIGGLSSNKNRKVKVAASEAVVISL